MLALMDIAAVGNPHSEHIAGRRSSAVVEKARRQVAESIGAATGEILFTSGATEANNLALQGIAKSEGRRGNHLVTMSTEHRCVLETIASLRSDGFEVDVLNPGENGLIDPDALRSVMRHDTALVSVMAANNEIGVLQPVREISSICRAAGAVFHTDAAQAIGKIPFDVADINADLVSLSGHKIYGPIGVGALFVSADCPVHLRPLFYGGGQERGLRSGTVSPLLCVALGTACEIAVSDRDKDAAAAVVMRDRFLDVIKKHLPDVRVNGAGAPRLPGNLSITIPGVDADLLVGMLQPDVAISTNAACSAGSIEQSHVLLSLGLSNLEAASTIRVSFGRFNILDEVTRAGEMVAAAAKKMRARDGESNYAQRSSAA